LDGVLWIVFLWLPQGQNAIGVTNDYGEVMKVFTVEPG